MVRLLLEAKLDIYYFWSQQSDQKVRKSFIIVLNQMTSFVMAFVQKLLKNKEITRWKLQIKILKSSFHHSNNIYLIFFP